MATMPTLDSVEDCQSAVASERQGESELSSTNKGKCGPDQPESPGVSDSSKESGLASVESPDAGEEEGWLKELSRVCGVHLPPDHPCLEYIRGQGLDLGSSDDFDKFTGNPSPLLGKTMVPCCDCEG